MPDEPRRPVSWGHCIHCGRLIVAYTRKEWSQLVKNKCPNCSRPW